MGKKGYFALGAAAVVVLLIALTWPISYVVFLIFVGDLLGVPCGGLC